MSDNINFLCESKPPTMILQKPSQPKYNENNHFEDEIRQELDIVTDMWKSSLAEKLAKKLKDFELIYKNKNSKDSAELQTENKELKAKLYDCMTTVSGHERELVAAKSSLQELLLAFTELSERYEEKSRELDSVRDELEKCLGTNGTFVVKQTEQSEDEGDEPLYYAEVRERAQKAIEQIDHVTATTTTTTNTTTATNKANLTKMNGVGSSSSSSSSSMFADTRTGRVKQLPLHSAMISTTNGHSSSLSRSNLTTSLLPTIFRDPSSSRSSLSHLSHNQDDEDNMLVETSLVKKRKLEESLTPIEELIKSSKVSVLSREELDRLFMESKQSATVFAGKLLRKYFSTQELTRNCNVRGNRCTRSKDPGVPRERLDPVRVELIQRHIFERAGEHNDEVWQRCIAKMNFIMNRMRKIKEDKFFERNKNY